MVSSSLAVQFSCLYVVCCIVVYDFCYDMVYDVRCIKCTTYVQSRGRKRLR